jgi:hypothetical protein
MKTPVLISLIAGLFCWSASAQTADDWVSQGRSYLAAHDIADANASFAQALSLDPSHETANAFYAITRLLVLPNQPAGSNFLTHIGYPVTGRDIYDWTSIAPRDAKRIPYAPSGVNANEFPAQLRTNVLYSISGAIGNLSVITDTGFSVSLNSSETASTDVTVDYGDLEMIQAGLYASEYFIYTLNTQNVAAQLTDIRALYDGRILTASQMLSDYPQMFTFTTTNDLQAARAAFTNAVNCYMTASAFIRARPPGEIRLFNYDKVTATNESNFRSVLTDLENSLTSPQVLSINTNVTVNFAKSFNGTTTGRSLLPKFSGNAMELGSLPDLTFGGVIGGLTRGQVEGYLSTYLTMLPVFNTPSPSANGASLTFNTLRGHNYLVEASTNLVNWQLVTNFASTNSVSTWIDSQGLPKRFYRLQDDTKYIAFSGVVLNQSTGLPIAGAQVQSLYDGKQVLTDNNGKFILVTSLTSPGYDYVQISAAGYYSIGSFGNFTGLLSGLQTYLTPLPPPPANDNFANRIGLIGINLTVTGSNAGASQETSEPNPTGNAAGQSVWWSWTAPTNGIVSINAAASSFYPLIEIYTGNSLLSLVALTNGGSSITFPVTAGTTYQISLDGYRYYNPSFGNISFNLNFIPTPPNDNFANRIVLTGSNVSVNGNNSNATWESGERYDTYYFLGYGNKSVWFSWTAPTTGSYVFSVSTTSVYYPILAIYTGSQLSSLSTVLDLVGSGYFIHYTFNAVAGQTYQIEIDDYFGIGSNYTLSIAQ